MPEAATWSCPTCRRDIATAFCPSCGETAVDRRDLTLRGLARQAFETFVAVDGKLMRSFRMLLRRPGALSLAYVRGQRVAFTGPFRVFLFANMLFFAAQSLTDASVVGTSLQSHLHEQDWSGIAQRLVASRLAELRTTLELYAPAFDRAVVLNAKSLIILMVLPFTGALTLTFLRGAQALCRACGLRTSFLCLPDARALCAALRRGRQRLAGRGGNARSRQAALRAAAGGERGLSLSRDRSRLRGARLGACARRRWR